MDDINKQAALVIERARAKGLTIAVAESCTGGLIGAALTSVAGSSAVFRGGIIAYDNIVKTKLLGVPPSTLGKYGAVSEKTAERMAAGALERLGVDIAVSVTGVAGPSGGSADKPVGTVWIGVARKNTGAKKSDFEKSNNEIPDNEIPDNEIIESNSSDNVNSGSDTKNPVTISAELHHFGDIGRNEVRSAACLEALKQLSQI